LFVCSLVLFVHERQTELHFLGRFVVDVRG
jgi:hypothetical protein